MFGKKKIRQLERKLQLRLEQIKNLTEIVHSNMKRIKELESINKERHDQVETITGILELQHTQIKKLQQKLTKISN